jgi:hypothetical protein
MAIIQQIFAFMSSQYFSEVRDQVSKGVRQQSCTWGGVLGHCYGLFLAHRLHLSHTALLMLESLGT